METKLKDLNEYINTNKRYITVIELIMLAIITFFISNIIINKKINDLNNELNIQKSKYTKMENKLKNEINILYNSLSIINEKNNELNQELNNKKDMFFNRDLKLYIRLADYISKFNSKNNLMISYYILYYSSKYNIPVNILTSLIYTESRFMPNSKSNKGCIGLTQVNPSIWSDLLIKENIISSNNDLYIIKNNIEAGSYILRYYYDETNSWKKALYRYYGISEYGNTYRDNVYNKSIEIKYKLKYIK